MENVKKKLNAAFKSMRANGLIARQAFSCCRGCAGCDLATAVGAMPEAKRARVAGVVFYTKQDASGMYDSRGKFLGLYLAYGPVDVSGVGQVGMPTEAVGAIVATALRLSGLEVEWDGQAVSRIRVIGEAKPVPVQPDFIDFTEVRS